MTNKYTYDARHTISVELDTPIKTVDRNSNYEITRVVLEADWTLTDPLSEIDRDGWWLDWTLRGFPLTSKGVRDKRVKNPEFISQYRYPDELKDEAQDILQLLIAVANIDAEDILNPDNGLLDEARYGENARVW